MSIEAKRSEIIWSPDSSPALPSPTSSPLPESCPSAKKGKEEDPFLAGNLKKGKRNIFWGKDTLLDILSEVTSKREGWGIFLSSVYNRRPQSGIWTNIQTFCFWLFIGFKVLLTKQGGKIMNLIADKMLLWGVYWFLTVSLHEFQMKNAKNLMRKVMQ